MKGNRKYLIAAALLAVAAVVFGATGTVAPSLEPISPQQSSSDAVPPYFIIPPNYDSGWVDITGKCGESFNITHNLNTTEVFVDITGKATLGGGTHQRNLGGTGWTPGWSKTYGGMNYDLAYSMVQTRDGGYALAGISGTYHNWDFLLVKTDSSGNMQWNKTYTRRDINQAYSVVETSDGGYALVGYSSPWPGPEPGSPSAGVWLVKTDSFGNVQWNATYGQGDYRYSVVQTSDGGYALAGLTTGGSLLIKTDPTGNMQWNRTYEEGGAYSLIQSADGGYALAGTIASWFWLVKTDSTGIVQWNMTYVLTDCDWGVCYSLVETSEGGYALAGKCYSAARGCDVLLVKTDESGAAQWNRTYGGAASEVAHSVVQTSDGGYALAGEPTYSGGLLLVRTDSSGNMQWNKTYEGATAYSVVQTSDGAYALAGWGWISHGPYSSPDCLLVKVGAESGLSWTDSTVNSITLYKGATDAYWNYVRVRVWTIEEPTWQYGDINQDGVVDAKDLYIVSRNYGKTFSVASLGGLVAVAGVHTYKKRKQKNR